MDKNPQDHDRSLDSVISSLMDGGLDAAQHQWLDEQLRHDAATADRLVELLDLHAMLQWEHGVVEHVSEESVNERIILVELFDVARQQRRLHEIEIEAQSLLQADLEHQRHVSTSADSVQSAAKAYQIVIPKALVWLGVAAALALAATLVITGIDRSQPQREIANNPIEPVEDVLPIHAVAALVEGFDASWRGPSPDQNGQFFAGQYELTGGVVKLRTTLGVELLLEAPITFQIDADNAVALHRGRLVADVPEQGHGFTVNTPTGRIVDYGTIFGVATDDQGHSIAHVFSGEIEVASRNTPDAPAVRLVQNEAASIDSGASVQKTNPIPEHFAREVPATAYQAAVLASRPMCYWRGLNDEETMQVTDHGWLQADGVASSALRADRVGYVIADPSGSLSLARGVDAYVEVQPRKEFVLDQSFSVEAWCWIDPNHQSLMRIVSTRSENGGFGFGVNGKAFGEFDRISPAPPNVPVFTFFQESDYVGDKVLPEAQWIHLAAVVDSKGDVSMYVDGLPISVHKINQAGAEQSLLNEAGVMIGRNPYAGKGEQAWEGRLDEVAIYDRALTAREIQKRIVTKQAP